MNTIYLEPSQVPALLRGGYTGKQFKAEVCESITIPFSAGLWDGGSRDSYSAVNLSTGESVPLRGQNSAPWDRNRREHKVDLQAGVVVIEHSIFCGKDMGLRFYVHPKDAVALLPAPAAELSAHEKIVLEATAGLKSSYGGRDRYQMMQDNYRYSGRPFPSRDEWNAAKATLITKGLLNKAGAITVAGRNANKR